MSDTQAQAALSQKAQAARRAREARTMSPEKAMRRALSRTADVLWDLVLVTKNVVCDQLDQAGVEGALNDEDLLILMDGPGSAVGFVAIERDVMASIIEVQTIGQVTKLPVDTRPLTQTDAAMVSPLIEGSLERLVSNLEDNPIADKVNGYRFGAMMEDPRAAALLLEAPSYLTFRAEIDLALGRRRGAMLFIFPAVEFSKDTQDAPGVDHKEGPFQAQLLNVTAELNTRLCKLSLPLARLRELKTGDLLELNPDCLEEVELRSPEGRIIAGGKLGQLNGNRAVRLNWPVTQSETDTSSNGSLDANTASIAAISPMPDGAVPNEEMAALPELPSLEFNEGDPSVEFGMPNAADAPDFEMGGFDMETPDSAVEETSGGDGVEDLSDFDFSGDFDMADVSVET